MQSLKSFNYVDISLWYECQPYMMQMGKKGGHDDLHCCVRDVIIRSHLGD